MGCISGWNLFRNATSFNKKVADLTKTIEEFPIKGIRIGIPKKYLLHRLMSLKSLEKEYLKVWFVIL